MKIMRSADEPDGGHAIAIFFSPCDGGLFHVWMIGEPEIIVGTKIQDLSLRHSNLALWGPRICRSDL